MVRPAIGTIGTVETLSPHLIVPSVEEGGLQDSLTSNGTQSNMDTFSEFRKNF